VRVDREQRLAHREIEFQRSAISAYRWRLYGGLQNPWKLRDIFEYRERAATAKESIANAREEIKSLHSIRAEVERLIAERQSKLRQTVRTETQLSEVLNRSVDRETELRVARGQELPSAQFNMQELRRLEENSITLHDRQMLGLTQREMESYLSQTPVGREKLAARAVGRSEAAEVLLQDVTQRIEHLNNNREFVPVIFRGADGQEKIASLHDFQPKTFSLRLFSAKDRVEMNAINEALDERHAELLSERNSLEQFAAGAREIADNWNQKLESPDQNLAIQQSALGPQFTARELSQIENFAAKQIDPNVRAQFENVVHTSLSTGQVADFAESPASVIRAANKNELQLSDPSQLHKDDYLEAARNALNKVASKPGAEYGTLNEAAAVAETEAGSEAWAVLL